MIFMHRHHASTTLLRLIAVLLAILIAIGALLLLSFREVAAQAGGRSSAILLIKGNDTLVVERIQRGDASVTAMIAMKGVPSVTLAYALTLSHLVSTATFIARGANAPADAPALQSGTLEFVGDSAIVRIRGAGGREVSQRIGTKAEALLIVNNDFVALEQAVRRARAKGVIRLTQPIFTLSGGMTLDAELDLFAPDSARFSLAGNVTVASIDTDGNVTGGHLPGQDIRLVVVTGPAAAGVSLGRPDYSAPAGAPYSAEEVVVTTAAGHRLTGTLTLPRGTGGPVPAVVTITGSGAQDRDEMIAFIPGFRLFRQVADTLGRRGIAVLRLDDRGVGGSGGPTDATSADFADDIRAGVAYLRSRAEVDPSRIALVGHSEGGLIAPLVAAGDPRLRAIVLMAGPAFTGRDIIDYQIANGVRGDPSIAAGAQDSIIAAQRAQFDAGAANASWMKWFLTYDPLPTARRVRQPVLILHGATDQQVRPVEAEMLERAIRDGGNRRVAVRVFPDRNHLFLRDPNGHPSGYIRLTEGKVDGEVMGTLADWLVSTLGGRP